MHLMSTNLEIECVLKEYYDEFHPDDDQGDHDPRATIDMLLDLKADNTCLEIFQNMSEIQLCELLGFSSTGQVPFFNSFLSLGNINPIDDPEAFEGLETADVLPEDMIPCRLRWAQLVAIAANIRMFTEEEDATKRRSMLLADEVGIGKTGIIMGTIAAYMHALKRHHKQEALPPIFSK
jgi:hypothetical protein